MLLCVAAGQLPLVTASAAASPAVSVVDLPTGDRWSPREADVVGANDAGFLYLEGGDAGATYGYTAHFRTYDGSADTVEDGVGPHTQLLGDRLLNVGRYMVPPSLRTRLLGDVGWTDVTLPAGTAYVGATEDGLLTATSGVPLQLTPWSGGAPTPVTGLPQGVTVGAITSPPEGTVTQDAQGAVLNAGTISSTVYVDTSALTAWVLPDSATGYLALGPQHVAWLGPGTDGKVSVHEVARPAGPSDAVSPTIRTMPSPTSWPIALTALSDGSVLVRRPYAWDQYSPSVVAHVQRLAPDGALTEELAWGHGTTALAGGGYLAVVGTTPRAAAIQRVQTPGQPGDPALVLTPVPARTGALALDGSRLVLATDTTADGTVQQHVLGTGGGVLSDTSSEDLATGVDVSFGNCLDKPPSCGGLASEAGVTGWNDRGHARVRQADGTQTGFPVGRGYGTDLVSRVSDRGVLAVSTAGIPEEDRALYDVASGTQTMGWHVADPSNPLELDATAVYLRDPFSMGSVAVRRLDTGAAASLPVQGCDGVSAVQTAGPWLLARCSTQLLLDRRDGSVTDLGAAPLWLGDGFVVRVVSGVLSWHDLADASGTWSTLGAVQPYGARVATSRGAEPLVAWVDEQGHAHAALLPVTTAPIVDTAWTVAAAPTPPAPAVTGYTSTSLELAWKAAPAEDQLRRYSVTAQPGGVTAVVAGDSTGVTLAGLRAGTAYTVTVKAESLAGVAWGTAAGTPKYDTPVWPSNVQATVDKVTSRVTVTWSLVPDAQFSDPLHFRVEAGNAVLDDVPVTARSASLVVHQAGYGQVLVHSVGAKAESLGATQNELAFPGDDTQAPSMRTSALPSVLLATSTSLRYSATDDRRVKDYQVAVRAAATGQPLGSWAYPTSWAHLTGTTLTLSGLAAGSTHCYAVRARDDAGNVSGWSPAVCTTVALDDRSWSRATSGWASSGSTSYYLGTGTTTYRSSQVLRRTGTRADAMTLVVVRCPTCGVVGVYDDGVLVAKVNLYASTTLRRALVQVPFGGRRTGVLTVRTLSTSKLVVVDGVALRSY